MIKQDIFMTHVIKTGIDTCWKWDGAKLKHGYGRYSGGLLAHRIAYELLVGPIPQGLLVLHSCDNPECTNPKHLFLGDHSDNAKDMVAKGRNRHHDQTGLKRSDEVKAKISASVKRTWENRHAPA